ncbi:hypothetical protein N7481_004215 [Penicillium waksmanii]|uniref:uncharacterized protein n=1 Tax=Penicillium waksmanii TaxID=69791 RepID=UPI00254924F0|nr:uncharacterized protein N7481_004215 [Penicillium waksmanii]KAJ5989005.1 hypothetical protein N7481_004215 [Penicillium waksmanii]
MKLPRACFLLVSVLLAPAKASPWFGTKYIAVVETVAVEGYTGKYLTEDPIMRTKTVEISPTVTNPSVISSYTETEGYSSEVTALNLVVESTAGVPVTANHYVDYYVSVTYTAPSSCSYTTKQSLTTTIPVYVPYDANGIVDPIWIKTTTEHYSYITGAYTEVNGLLDPTAIPASIFSSASSQYMPAYYTSCYSYYADSDSNSGDSDSTGYGSGGDSSYYNCKEFTWNAGNSVIGGGYCCFDGCHYTWGITPWAIALAVIFSWFGLCTIIGFVESWFIYRRAMLGGKVRRGFPYAFACSFPILSCLSLLSVKRYPAKTPDQQAFLAARWTEMSSGTKFSSWLNSFFKRRDPTAETLGITAPMTAHISYLPPDQTQVYSPAGGPDGNGIPPMSTPSPHQGQASTDTPRGEELDAEPKTIAVNEAERNERAQ